MRGNSFGALRLLASLSVIYTHSFPLALGAAFHEPLIGLPFSLGTLGVFVFFVISGILVTKSFIQSRSVVHFLVYSSEDISSPGGLSGAMCSCHGAARYAGVLVRIFHIIPTLDLLVERYFLAGRRADHAAGSVCR